LISYPKILQHIKLCLIAEHNLIFSLILKNITDDYNIFIVERIIAVLKRDVLAKPYVGDITRKCKLLYKQKAGKKKMSTIGNVEIPKSAFIEELKVGS